jgi:hypothetical protein
MTKCAGFFSMPEPDLIELFVRPLDRFQFRYLISGSVASMLYGEPRVTHDIDLIIFLRSTDIERLPEAFPPPEFYVPPLDVIAVEVARTTRGQFNVIHPDSGLKADFHTANRDELHAWAFRNVRRYTLAGEAIRLAPPEYVIVRKLEYFREGGSDKHLRDIRGMLNISGELLDRPALDEWIRRRGLQAEWVKAST